MKAFVVYNNYSGNCSEEKVTFISKRLKEKYEYVEVFSSNGPKSITKIIKEKGATFDLVVAIGGDGSIHEAINGLMQVKENRPALAYIPLGTCNDVGHSLGLNKNYKKSVERILTGQKVTMDLFKANNEYFIYALGAGYLTEISYLAPSENKKRFGKMAYYLEALKHVVKKKIMTIDIETENEHITGDYSILLALNSRYLAGFKLKSKKKTYLNDGTLSITLIRKTHRWINIIDLALFLLFGDKHATNCHHFKAKSFVLKSKDIISFNADGEHLVDDNMLKVEVVEDAIEVIVAPKIKNKYFINK